MTKATHIRVGGSWKQVNNVWQRVSGEWKEEVVPNVRVSGAWKECMEYGLPLLYDGEMTVGRHYYEDMEGAYEIYGYFVSNYGSINPSDNKLSHFRAICHNDIYNSIIVYDTVEMSISDIKVDDTTYTSAETLWNDLKTAYNSSETVEIKIYE